MAMSVPLFPVEPLQSLPEGGGRLSRPCRQRQLRRQHVLRGANLALDGLNSLASGSVGMLGPPEVHAEIQQHVRQRVIDRGGPPQF